MINNKWLHSLHRSSLTQVQILLNPAEKTHTDLPGKQEKPQFTKNEFR